MLRIPKTNKERKCEYLLVSGFNVKPIINKETLQANFGNSCFYRNLLMNVLVYIHESLTITRTELLQFTISVIQSKF